MRPNEILDARFNLDVFQHALKEYFKKKEEKDKRMKKEKAARDKAPKNKKPLSGVLGMQMSLQIIVILLMFCAFLYFGRESAFFSGIMWSGGNK